MSVVVRQRESVMRYRIVPLVVVLSFIFGSPSAWMSAGSVQAQNEEIQGIDGNTYTSPTWGYSFSWSDEWTVNYAGEVEVGRADFVQLERMLLGRPIRLLIQGGYWAVHDGSMRMIRSDPKACVRDGIGWYLSQANTEDFQPAKANGRPIGGGHWIRFLRGL